MDKHTVQSSKYSFDTELGLSNKQEHCSLPLVVVLWPRRVFRIGKQDRII